MAITFDYDIDKITLDEVEANSFVKTGGTSTQFLKADGTVDSNNYLTSFTEVNDLTVNVTWDIVPDAYISQSSITQHQAALTITTSQISDYVVSALADLSVTSNPASGGGTLSYDNISGTFTYTPPDLSLFLTDAPSDGNPYARQNGTWTQVVTNEVNDLTASVTWANVPDVNITQSSVTQHEAALSITESQISDLQSYYLASNPNNYITTAGEINDLTVSVTWANVPDANITQTSVTQHQAALSITESQISDLQTYYLASNPNNYIDNTIPTLDSVTDNNPTTTNDITVGNITTGGYLAGPATFTIDPAAIGDNTGLVVIAGSLQVDGTTTTVNSTTVEVDDKNILLGSGSINAGAANGGGITLDCGADVDATILYDGINDQWDLNKDITAPSFIKNGGASTEFLKADGSVDSTTYLTANDPTLDSVTDNNNTTTNDIIVGSATIRTAFQTVPEYLTFNPTSTNYTASEWGGILIESSDASGAGSGVKGSIRALSNSGTGGRLSWQFNVADGTTNDKFALAIENTGEVGIGEVEPQTLLHLGTSDPRIRLDQNNSIGYSEIYVSSLGDLVLHADSGDNVIPAGILKFSVGPATDAMIINESGNVNIGFSGVQPRSKLTVVDSSVSLGDTATSGGTAWNTAGHSQAFLKADNNGFAIGLDGTNSSRKGWLQVGHSSESFSDFLGTLSLNPLGGNVEIGGALSVCNTEGTNYTTETDAGVTIFGDVLADHWAEIGDFPAGIHYIRFQETRGTTTGHYLYCFVIHTDGSIIYDDVSYTGDHTEWVHFIEDTPAAGKSGHLGPYWKVTGSTYTLYFTLSTQGIGSISSVIEKISATGTSWDPSFKTPIFNVTDLGSSAPSGLYVFDSPSRAFSERVGGNYIGSKMMLRSLGGFGDPVDEAGGELRILGNSTFGGCKPQVSLTDANSSYFLQADASTNTFQIAYNALGHTYSPTVLAAINSSGNMGINETDPQTTLHITQTTDDSSDGIRVARSNSAASYTQWVDSGARYNFGYSNPETTDPATSILTLGGVNSRVGIVTTAPDTLFEMEAPDTTTDAALTISMPSSATADPLVNFRLIGNTIWSVGADATDGYFKIGRGGTLNNLASTNFVIDSSGNVGLGTDAPTNKLVVSDGDDGLEFRTNLANDNRILSYNRTTAAYTKMSFDADSYDFRIDGAAPSLSVDTTGNVTIDGGKLRLTRENDLSLSSTAHAFQIGPDGGNNVAIDGNEIMARNNGAASPLYLNAEGGTVSIGGQLQVSSTNGLRHERYQTATNTFTVEQANPTRYVRLGLVPPGNARLRITWTGNSGYNNFVADFSTQFKGSTGSNGEDTTAQVQTVYADSGNSEIRHLYFEYVNSQSAYVWALIVNPAGSDQTYYTHLEGNFTDTTTLNWSSPTVNAANFNASAPTANPAAFYKNGKVLIGSDDSFNTTPANDPLTVSNSAALGSTLYDTQPLQTWTGANGNVGALELFQFRHTAGSTWTQASTRLQHRIDSTYQGYIQFNGPGNNYGVSLGYGTGTPADIEDAVDGLILDISGNIDIPVGDLTVSSGAVNIGAAIGSKPTLSLEGSDSDSSPFAVKVSGKSTVFSVLPWSSGETFITSGVYYEDNAWVHASDNAYSTLLAISGLYGARFWASSNSSASFNLANTASLWNNTGQWDNQLSTNVTYNGNTIWHSGNDGAGSGLAADTADTATTATNQSGGTVSATTGSFSGTITSSVASDGTILSWNNSGYLRRLTTQGGFFLGGDSSGIIHAGDQANSLRTALGITDSTTSENLYFVADGNVQIRTNWQDVGNSNDKTWTFGTNGALTVPGIVSATGATLTGLSNQASETTALVINGSNQVGTRELGSNAFNSTAFLTANQTITLSGDVTGSGTTAITCTVVNDSHTHDTRYYTETESDARFTSIDHFRAISTRAYTSTTTAALFETEMLADDYFDSYLAAGKASWSYAGNADLTDAGNLTELAGCSFLTWTDNSADNTLGNYTALVIAPNTGGSAYRTMIYNDQGSSYAPGWREILTDKTYNDFVPSLAGAGATGSWNISITGNASTATTATNQSGGSVSATTGSFSGDVDFNGGAGAINITNSDIRSSATSSWTGNPTTEGKLQYHSNRWYIVADSSSNRIVQFRRSATDVSYIDNSGNYVGNVSGNATTVTLNAEDTGNAQREMLYKVGTAIHSTPNVTYNGSQDLFRVYSAARFDADISMSAGTIDRTAIATGFLNGKYSGVETSTSTGAIYAIGDSWLPSTTTLSNHYGIGYTNSNASFITFETGSWGQYVSADGDARIWFNATNGNIFATGNITAYASDARLKTNVKPIENAVDKLQKIRGVSYDWVDDIESEYGFTPKSKHEVGVLAQEVEEVLPEVVRTAPFNGIYNQSQAHKNIEEKLGLSNEDAQKHFSDLPEEERAEWYTENNFLTVDYERIVPLLIEAIKEQQAQIDELKGMIK